METKPIILSKEEREELTKISHSQKTENRLVRRAKII